MGLLSLSGKCSLSFAWQQQQPCGRQPGHVKAWIVGT